MRNAFYILSAAASAALAILLPLPAGAMMLWLLEPVWPTRRKLRRG